MQERQMIGDGQTLVFDVKMLTVFCCGILTITVLNIYLFCLHLNVGITLKKMKKKRRMIANYLYCVDAICVNRY